MEEAEELYVGFGYDEEGTENEEGRGRRMRL